MMVKSGAIEIIFKSHEPFESYLPANWPSQFSQKGLLGRACLTLKGLVGFENNFNDTTFHHHFCVKTGVKCP